MTDVKKKRRRRSPSKPTAKRKAKKSVPSIKQQQKEAEQIAATLEPTNTLSGVERLNQIPDYTKTSQPNVVARTYAHYQARTLAQLLEDWKDPNNTALELGIIAQMIKVIKGSTGSLSIQQYAHARIEGKPKERIEHSGPGGGPIQSKETRALDISKLDKKGRAELRTALKAIKKVPLRVDDESSGES